MHKCSLTLLCTAYHPHAYTMRAFSRSRKRMSSDSELMAIPPPGGTHHRRRGACGDPDVYTSAPLMCEEAAERVREMVDTVYRADSRPVLATLIRLLGDFDLAEEALHDAFTAAVEQWPRDGVPVNPRAWLVSAGRFKAIDGLRRRARFDALLAEHAERLDADIRDAARWDDEGIEDD